jgi:hypothetical protein
MPLSAACCGCCVFLEPIQKVIESNESFVIPCVAPESQTWGAACGSLNIVVLPITVAFAIRAIRRTRNGHWSSR